MHRPNKNLILPAWFKNATRIKKKVNAKISINSLQDSLFIIFVSEEQMDERKIIGLEFDKTLIIII